MKNSVIILALLLTGFTGLKGQDLFKARKLSSSPAREGFPSFSPDSRFIVCQRTEMNDSTDQNGLWKIPVIYASGAEQIYNGVAEHPRWSPDGLLIVFDADTGRNMKMIPAEGGEPISFLTDSVQIRNGGLPSWSPDGTQIAFIEGSSIALCVFNSRTGRVKTLYREEGIVPLPGGWTSDGAYIVTALMERESRKSTIWMISTQGKANRQISGHHENFYRHLALSPDDSLLVYAAMEDGFLGLYIMLTRGGPSLPLAVSKEGHNDGPSWSPDGRMLAYSDGHGDIWIVEMDPKKVAARLRSLTESSL